MGNTPIDEEYRKRISYLEKELFSVKDALAKVEEEQQTYRLILENISDILIVTDDRGSINYVCPNTSSIFSISQEDAYRLTNIENLLNGKVFNIEDLREKSEIKNIEWEITDQAAQKKIVLVSVKKINIPVGSVLYVIHDITDLKQAEEALLESKKRYHELFENSTDFVYTLDLKGNFTDVNKAAEDLTGYTKNELIGMNYKNYTPEATHERIFEVFNGFFNETKPLKDFPLEVRIKDGSTRYFETCVSLLKQGEEIIGFQGSSRDITEHKRAEEALQNSRSMLQTVLDSIPSAVFWKDRDSNYLGANRTFLETVGLKSSEDVVGKSDYDLPWKKDQADLFREDDRKVMESGTIKYGIVESYQRVDGTQAWARTNKVPLRDEDGIITGVLGTYEDITELTEALEASLISEEKFRSIFENSSEGIVLADIETKKLINSNQKFCEMFGYDMKEITHLGVENIHARKDLPHVIKVFEKQAKGKVALAGDMPCLRKDGTAFYADISTTTTYIYGKMYIIGFFRDITERKRMEEEILKTEKLESLGILAGGIAHDFNNILTTILGNISLAKDETDPKSETFELLSEAEKASKRAQALTKQLLTFAKGGTPVKETASLGDIIKESSLFVLRGSKSDCEFSIAEDLRPVDIDVGQISQVINNIVINANQAMREGGIIEVKAENLTIDEGNEWQLKPGRYVRMSIKDEGVGIAKKHLSKIFDPYFSTKQKGSGLGLATAYSIVKKHSGIITVESQSGAGTTFHIYLPASEKVAPEKREDKVIKGRGKILVMEDSMPLRKMIGRMLDKLGYEPGFAKDGDKAIRMVIKAKKAKKPYDAVILDLTVPGRMGGKEAIQKLLEIDPGIRAIVSSGYSDDQVLANFQEYGFKGMIPKPFESVSLSKVLHEVLKGKKG